MGNLKDYTYANGVKTSYTYNTLNRLTNVASTKTAATLTSFAYTLGAAGNRTSVTEQSGRTVNYSYDSLYRLTSETILNSPNPSNNGSISYTYDPVGNRLSRNSTVIGVPSTINTTFDLNDRLTSDGYDANGNTVASSGNGYVYDFENRLLKVNAGTASEISLVYDGDGNRVSKTVAGVTTKFLVDTNNLTGYAQVVEEVQGSNVVRQYSYGHDLISQRQLISGNWATSFYQYDGHGSVRGLTDSTGVLTDTFTYEAFGVLIQRTGTTPNLYLYAGEQFDPDLGLYYNRARYLNTNTGRFWTQDSYEGNRQVPLSLHKYLYTHANPVNNSDPSGHLLAEEVEAQVVQRTILGMTVLQFKQVLVALAATLLVAGEIVGPLGELEAAKEENAKKTKGRYYFRGDDDYKMGSPMGLPLDSDEANGADIQEPWEHVLKKESRDTSRFTSFAETFVAAKFFGKRVYKVLIADLIILETTGLIRIIDRETVFAITKNHPKSKVRKLAPGVRQQMELNEEVLIEGQIPAIIIKGAN